METNPKHFFCLPFKEINYHITEGWHYSQEEKNIHGSSGHGGIDFAFPRGTEVLAAADGWAISSYFCRPLKNEDGTPKIYLGKEVSMGLGYFVQIYHPQIDLYSTYGHLDKISKEIPFHKPVKRGVILWPVGHKIKPNDLPKHKLAKFIVKGTVIGYVGDSGLTWGYQDYPERPNPDNFPSWDETHLHFEVFMRVGSKGNKKHFDPFGIKSDFNDYPDPDRLNNRKNIGTKSSALWILNQEAMPKFSE